MSLSVILDFIDMWLKGLESKYAWSCVVYQENRREILKIITTNPTPTPEDFKKKHQLRLKYEGGEWYMKTNLSRHFHLKSHVQARSIKRKIIPLREI